LQALFSQFLLVTKVIFRRVFLWVFSTVVLQWAQFTQQKHPFWLTAVNKAIYLL